jgi:lipopolysaccharide biosynthesis glycosyltransferase
MLFMTDIKKLFAMADPKYAVLCVKHQHLPPIGIKKMDGREQLRYHRKNWSSFMLFNCGHEANKALTSDRVNCAKGSDLHALCWLKDSEIGALPMTYNYISGVSPKMDLKAIDVIHYTEGGAWFPECKDQPYNDLWIAEHNHWSANGHDIISPIQSTAFEK